MVVESDLNLFLSGLPDKTKKDVELEQFKKNTLNPGDEDQGIVELNRDKIVDNKCTDEIAGNVDVYEKQSNIQDGNGENDRASDEDPDSRKRKRECYLDILNWLTNIAKNPCNPAVGSIPEMQKWKYYGSEQMWTKILFVREEMILKRNADKTSQHSIWQKKQKMHPSMYEDQSVSESLRFSQRLLVAKDSSSKTRGQLCSEPSSSGGLSVKYSSDKQSDSTADSIGFGGNHTHKKYIPIGTPFQVDVPKYTEAAYDSDSKWLGTRIWPLDKGGHNKSLIERDPIGKGRQESCGCQFPGSLDCARFHVGEKRIKVKLELGLAFYEWKFNSMGEEDALSWIKRDENKFQDIVNLKQLSSEKYFWDELFKCFPRRGREALVSYYFNVFLLRRRSQQNRNITSSIHSDDEDSEFGPTCNRFGQMAAQSPGSIFRSPKKTNVKRN